MARSIFNPTSFSRGFKYLVDESALDGIPLNVIRQNLDFFYIAGSSWRNLIHIVGKTGEIASTPHGRLASDLIRLITNNGTEPYDSEHDFFRLEERELDFIIGVYDRLSRGETIFEAEPAEVSGYEEFSKTLDKYLPEGFSCEVEPSKGYTSLGQSRLVEIEINTHSYFFHSEDNYFSREKVIKHMDIIGSVSRNLDELSTKLELLKNNNLIPVELDTYYPFSERLINPETDPTVCTVAYAAYVSDFEAPVRILVSSGPRVKHPLETTVANTNTLKAKGFVERGYEVWEKHNLPNNVSVCYVE